MVNTGRSFSGTIMAILCIVLLTPSCQTSLIEEEALAIEDFVSSISITPDYVLDDVNVIIMELGDDTRPVVETSTVEVRYTGSYLDGEIFDDRNTVTPVSLKLSSAISGLQIGLPLIGKGGRAIVIIPSRHAYGKNPPRGIKRNAVLVYDVTLIGF